MRAHDRDADAGDSSWLAAAGILVTMLLAAVPATRRANRLDLAEATKVLA